MLFLAQTQDKCGTWKLIFLKKAKEATISINMVKSENTLRSWMTMGAAPRKFPSVVQVWAKLIVKDQQFFYAYQSPLSTSPILSKGMAKTDTAWYQWSVYYSCTNIKMLTNLLQEDFALSFQNKLFPTLSISGERKWGCFF